MQSRRLRVLLPLLALLACKPPEATQQPPTGDAGGQAQRDPAAILAASDLPALLPSPLPDDTLGVTIHRLSNGLTVYISTDREEPQLQRLDRRPRRQPPRSRRTPPASRTTSST
jgi:hypothetical protein